MGSYNIFFYNGGGKAMIAPIEKCSFDDFLDYVGNLGSPIKILISDSIMHRNSKHSPFRVI